MAGEELAVVLIIRVVADIGGGLVDAQQAELESAARELNRLNIKTGRGCQWYDVTVKAALQQGSEADEAAA